MHSDNNLRNFSNKSECKLIKNKERNLCFGSELVRLSVIKRLPYGIKIRFASLEQ
jgi:hypothetical protein